MTEPRNLGNNADDAADLIEEAVLTMMQVVIENSTDRDLIHNVNDLGNLCLLLLKDMRVGIRRSKVRSYTRRLDQLLKAMEIERDDY